jgi:light-regulated signal transduction histidine kinase (bacteriophytochrome)
MASLAQPNPAFGTADLSNCERELIHLAGSIQPFGALLLVREPDLIIVQASANATDFLGLDRPLLGLGLMALPGDLLERIRPHLETSLAEIPVGVRCKLGTPPSAFDGLLHRPAGGGLAIELERAGPDVDLSRHVERALKSILACSSLQMLCDETAKLFRNLTGYDRVMVYRFDEEGHGQVFSERKKPQFESFLGNWYPASDIPQIARRLYERNRVRILVDVAAVPVPLVPTLSPLSDQDLDMSLCFLRSMSPLHIEYLKNMGVGATLVVSLMVGGKLWGLIACHNDLPRFVHFEVRAVCELLAEAVATRISALDAFAQAQAELSVRRLEQRMVEAISKEGDWRAALFDKSQALLTPVGAEGAALLLDGQVMTAGEVPGTLHIRAIGAWLERRPQAPVTASASLRRDAPDLAELMPEIGGLLAAPISNSPGDYLIWFRPERIKTVTWGGDPFKPFTVGNNARDLSPRRSFAQWHELVEGTCEPWASADLTTGRLIGETVADVVLQFRSVRMLIVQDQLDKVGRQVEASAQPVVIANAQGRILLTNGAFNTLLNGRSPPLRIEEMARYFVEPRTIEQNLKDLMRHRRPWRGEVHFETGPDRPLLPLLVRADPVLSSPGRVLGFVILFLDISERQAAETARRRFQDSIVTPHQLDAVRLNAVADPMYQTLVSTVIENAQVAALEITDSLDMGRIPEMLDSIRNSVDRAAEVLGRLVWHATRAAGDEE